MRTLLSLVLTTSSLALMFFLRSLGNALGKVERMCVSEAAMLKQARAGGRCVAHRPRRGAAAGAHEGGRAGAAARNAPA